MSPEHVSREVLEQILSRRIPIEDQVRALAREVPGAIQSYWNVPVDVKLTSRSHAVDVHGAHGVSYARDPRGLWIVPSWVRTWPAAPRSPLISFRVAERKDEIAASLWSELARPYQVIVEEWLAMGLLEALRVAFDGPIHNTGLRSHPCPTCHGMILDLAPASAFRRNGIVSLHSTPPCESHSESESQYVAVV